MPYHRPRISPHQNPLSVDHSKDTVSIFSRTGVRNTIALVTFVALACGGTDQAVYGQTPPIVPATQAVRASVNRPVNLSGQKTLYVVTYSHLDTEWCWTYRHSIQEYIPDTLTENFSLFEKYPDYVFNWTGASRYRFVKDYYPEEYARLKRYVAAGRWIPTGSAWDENDAIVPSPESIIRSVMYSNRWFQKEFGKTSNQYMMPDTFGFPASLPSILAHCGLKGFSTKKLTYGAGSAVGIPFNVGRWVGPDGRSVIAALNPGDYRTRITEDLTQSKPWLARLEANGKSSGIFADYMYHGNGDLGGSPGVESAGWLQRSLAGDGPVQVRAGGADDLFHDITPEQAIGLPAYQGDLLLIQHSAGSINSGAAMKRWNHRNERLADAAERAAVSASLVADSPYPTERLTQGWLRFLGGQMHDILPGTSIPAAYEFAWNDQVIALNQFADVATHGVSQIAWQMDTRTKGVPLVVYNPLSTERDDVVTAEVVFPGTAPANIQVFGPDGKEVPAQLKSRKGNRIAVLFLARVPAVGCAVFDVRRATHPATRGRSPLQVTTEGMENARYRLRLDANGDIASIFDKAARREILSAPMRLAFLREKPKQHPAWNMDWEDRQKPPVGHVDGPVTVTVRENGPARVALQVERSAHGSTFRQTVRLSAGTAGNRVEFVTDVDWRTAESSLKAVFPLTVSHPEATYNLGVGTVRRGKNEPKKYEVPAQEWFDLTDKTGGYGVSVLNEAKYGSDKPDDSTLRLTLLYTPGVRDRFQHQATQDWGHHEILYALQGHNGDWRAARTADQAARLNQPLLVFQTPSHGGERGRVFSLLTLSTPGVTVAALKKAEDSQEVIVRLFEQDGKPASGVRLKMATPIIGVREVNGQEQEIIPDGKVGIRKGALVFDMKTYRPRAFALTLKSPPIPPPSRENVMLSLPFDVRAASSGKGETDGAFDTQGRSYPGELLPAVLESGGVTFRSGSSGATAVACAGQSIHLPDAASSASQYVYLLAAAEADIQTTLRFVGKAGESVSAPLTIQSWDGYVGQWDTRLWKGVVPEKDAVWNNKYAGLSPGYIKRQPIAWYADHLRLKNGANDPYHFCYLFRYAVRVPKGTESIVLPADTRIRIFAATLSDQPADVSPAYPLYDDLSSERPSANNPL
ncbi:MAG: alpha-mannosidase [Fibrella sp.]|nr:alpha-mannosidase [Armatimonadota bacterium]